MNEFLLWVTEAPSHWGTLGRNGEHSPEFSHLRNATEMFAPQVG